MRVQTVTISILAVTLLSIALLAVVLPFIWNSGVGFGTAVYGWQTYINNKIASDVLFIPPPAKNPDLVNQIAVVANTGYAPLKNLKVLMIDTNGNKTELNLTKLTLEGNLISVGTVTDLYIGEAVIADVPVLSDYTGYTFVVSSTYYTISERVG